MTTKATLKFYVEDFKKWRQENYKNEQIVINATNDVSYSSWDELVNFFGQLLDTKQISLLDKDDKVNLLYLIARGWDNGAFLYELSDQRPISTCGDLSDEDFIELARVAVTLVGKEYDDAKSQIANCFRKLDYLTPEIEGILLKLYGSKEEYIKRQALISLAKLGYKDIISLVEKSWTIGDEWHKIACLNVLDKYVDNKELMNGYLSEAVNSKQKDLSECASELKTKNNC